MNIHIGLLNHSHGWEQLLRQEGVPWSVVEGEFPRNGADYSVVVVNRPLSALEDKPLREFLGSGGAILAPAHYLHGRAGVETRPVWLQFLTADRHGLFSEIGLMDVEREGHIPREATLLRTQQGEFSTFAGAFHGGVAVLLPFDPAGLLLDTRAATKNFHARRDRLPSERVSVVSKGDLRHLLHRGLEFLHHARGAAYAHLWWYPARGRNVVGLRIDTDGASQAEIDALYQIARETGIAFTWLIDVKGNAELLPHFASMIGQEAGVHCYEHREYSSREDALVDLGKAQSVLRSVGLGGEGMGAPYGQWSEMLADAQDELGFLYASEFSHAYDTLPFVPARAARPYRVMQVPVHPICPGSLRRAGYTDGEMAVYFADVADAKLLRRDPLFFYHHPSHHAWGVIRGMLRHALDAGCQPLTLGAYARWWAQRAACEVRFRMERDSLAAAVEAGDGTDIWVRIADTEGRETFASVQDQIPFSGQEWTVVPAYVPPADVRRIREFDPRALLGQIYAAMTRRIR